MAEDETALAPIEADPASALERMAKAAWEGQRARINPTLPPGDPLLLAWEEEPAELRRDWRQFILDAMEELREPGDDLLDAALDAPVSLAHLEAERDKAKLTLATQLHAIVTAIIFQAPPEPMVPAETRRPDEPEAGESSLLQPIADEEEAVG